MYAPFTICILLFVGSKRYYLLAQSGAVDLAMGRRRSSIATPRRGRSRSRSGATEAVPAVAATGATAKAAATGAPAKARPQARQPKPGLAATGAPAKAAATGASSSHRRPDPEPEPAWVPLDGPAPVVLLCANCGTAWFSVWWHRTGHWLCKECGDLADQLQLPSARRHHYLGLPDLQG
jgi:hypothetical protein